MTRTRAALKAAADMAMLLVTLAVIVAVAAMVLSIAFLAWAR